MKIVGERTELHAQGYFVYDSKKSGAQTVSHLRFSPRPIGSTYLIDQADFVACHQLSILLIASTCSAAPGPARPCCSTCRSRPSEAWDALPMPVQQVILDKQLRVHVIDAHRVAREVGLGGRINTVMQPCFFALAGILPREEAIAAVRDAVVGSYGRRGPEVVDRNLAAIDRALQELHELAVPDRVTSTIDFRPPVPATAPDFVQRVTARILAGEGDLLPVSALPVDGTFPTGTTQYEKRGLAAELPIWDPDICIDCGKCAIVCPHDAIQMKVFEPEAIADAPASFKSKGFKARELATPHLLTIQVAPDDCTGCGVCVQQCPATSKEAVGHKAIDMLPAPEHRDAERERFDVFTAIPPLDRDALTARHDQGLAGAAAAVQLLQRLRGLRRDAVPQAAHPAVRRPHPGRQRHRLLLDLRREPADHPVERQRRGPRPRLGQQPVRGQRGVRPGPAPGLDQHAAAARRILAGLGGVVGDDLVRAVLDSPQATEPEIRAQRDRVAELERRLRGLQDPAPDILDLQQLLGALVRKDVWIVGGDGWAYDIGFGGVDHVLASGVDVNLLVLDTEVYSNTGGQASKATPRAAVAKFATAGKAVPKKDLGASAMQYGTVYVAQIAMGANDVQTVRALLEAAAHPGPSLVLAYSLHRARLRHARLDGPSERRGQERVLAALPLQRRPPRSTASRSAWTPASRRSRSRTSPAPRRASRCWSAATRSARPT